MAEDDGMTFQLTLDIAAPPAEVFDFVADFTTMPEWYSAVQRVQRIDGSGGLRPRLSSGRSPKDSSSAGCGTTWASSRPSWSADQTPRGIH